MARSTKEDSLITRGLLLDAAEVLFATKGIATVTLSQIAYHVGVTTGGLYWHFENKRALLSAMYDRAYAPLAKMIAAYDHKTGEGSGIEEL